ncbi:MAG TPA: FAD-binding protein, partial [Dehalococcoidia bacterium]
MASFRRVNTDVLIIGGGGAAVRAAIAADEAGARVAMLVKGQVAHSGLTSMACPSYQAAGAFEEPEDTPEVAFADVTKEGRYLGDENLIRVLVDEATDRALEMERYGVKLTKTEDGRIFQVMHPGQTYARNLVIRGCGYGMMIGLRRELLRRPSIQTFEDFVATRLLKDGDRVAGAVALNLRTADVVVFQARSTIMATGGYEEIMEFTDTEPGASGDGTALALRAGASMVDLEMMLFYPTCLVWPDEVKGTLVQYEGLLGPRYLQGKMVNGLDDEFLPHVEERYALPVRDIMMKAMFREIDEGRGTPHGGVFIDLRRSPRSEK